MRTLAKKTTSIQTLKRWDKSANNGYKKGVAWDKLLGILSKKGDKKGVTEMLKTMQNSKAKPSTYTYNCLMNVQQSYTDVKRCIGDMRKLRVNPDQFTVMTILKLTRRFKGEPDTVWMLLDEEEENLQLDQKSLNNYLCLLQETILREWYKSEEAMRRLHVLLSRMRDQELLDNVSINTVIRLLLWDKLTMWDNEKLFRAAFGSSPNPQRPITLQILDSSGPRSVDITTYNILIARTGSWVEFEQLIQRLEIKGLVPDIVTLNSIISATSECTPEELFRRMDLVLKYASKANIRLDIGIVKAFVRQTCVAGLGNVLLDSIVNVRVENKFSERLLNFWSDLTRDVHLDRSALEPIVLWIRRNEECVDSVIWRILEFLDRTGLRKAGELTKQIAPEWIKNKKLQGHKPESCLLCTAALLEFTEDASARVSIWNSIIGFAASTGNLTEAKRLVDLMVKDNCMPTEFTFHNLIFAISRSGVSTKLDYVLQEMIKYKITPSHRTLTNVLKCHMNNHRYSHAFRDWDSMIKNFRIKPDSEAWEQVLEVARRARSFRHGRKYFETMRSSMVTPTVNCWNSFLGVNSAKSFEVYEEMKNHVVPDHKTLSILLGCLWSREVNGVDRQKYFEMGKEFFHKIFPNTHGVIPNQRNFAAFLDLAERYGEVSEIREIKEEMDRRFDAFTPEAKVGVIGGVKFKNGLGRSTSEKDIAKKTRKFLQIIEDFGYKRQLSALPVLAEHDIRFKDQRISSLDLHAEKKALAYLLESGIREPFVSVSARMCADCHHAYSIASQMFGVVIRCEDTYGLHVFGKDGSCSCKNHWRT